MAYAAFDPEVRVLCCLRAHDHACVCAGCQPVTACQGSSSSGVRRASRQPASLPCRLLGLCAHGAS